MKIQIVGSMKFASEMEKVKSKLESLGHEVTVPTDLEVHLKDPDFADNLEDNLKHCIEEDTIRQNFKRVADADGILVINHPKNGINGYIGTSSLMEIGIAHYLEKKIFILFNIPHFREQRWAHEVAIMQPVFLGGDLSKIS